MNRGASGIAVTVAMVTMMVTIVFAAIATPRPDRPDDSPSTLRVERSYVLSARVRPLLFWIRRDHVGAGKITWSIRPDGSQGVELLIGSDPDRAPMRVNRWGYIAEFHGKGSAEIIGVMTQSDEQTAEQARRKLDQRRGSGHPYRAMRTRIVAEQAETSIFSLALPDSVTYRPVDAVRPEVLSRTGSSGQLTVPSDADHGFLTAVNRIVEQQVDVYQAGRPPVQKVSRRFVYANRLYEVTAMSTEAGAAFRYCHTVFTVLVSEFQVVNRGTSRSSEFQMAYGVEPPLKGVPIRVVFRPNWWFEAELHLDPVCNSPGSKQ